MKRFLLIIAGVALLVSSAFAGGTDARDGGQVPSNYTGVGGKGGDGKFYPMVTHASTVVSTALEASHVLKASAGRLVSLHVYNSKASAQWVLIMNSATVPGDGAVTLLYPPIYIPATSNISLTFPVPLSASTGISVSNSSTGTFTKTIGSADCVYVAQVMGQ
jgi:hypothetical protein